MNELLKLSSFSHLKKYLQWNLAVKNVIETHVFVAMTNGIVVWFSLTSFQDMTKKFSQQLL